MNVIVADYVERKYYRTWHLKRNCLDKVILPEAVLSMGISGLHKKCHIFNSIDMLGGVCFLLFINSLFFHNKLA